MKKYLILILFCLVTLFCTSKIFGENSKPEIKLFIDDFGINEGKAIDNGFVFFEGQYIDAPYTVTRKGLAVFVNGRMVEKPIMWPRPDTTQNVDPKLPEGITRNSNFEDIREHMHKKYLYIFQHYPEGEAVQNFVDYYRSLPCIKEVEFTSPDHSSIKVTFFSGKVQNERVRPFGKNRNVKYDKETVLKIVESSREHLEERLQKGDTYFFFNTGGEITFGAVGSKETLPHIAKILRSSKPAKDKFKEVQKAGLPSVNERSFSSIVTNFSASPQLEERLGKLKESQKQERQN
ncbi:MAG: hypothetical protein PHS54_07335 [Clostridia bacterium]|nr:hypothetical protein [Clostridia bacterium]